MPLKAFVFFLLTICLSFSSDDSLLKMGQKDNCIKGIISSHLHTSDCHEISDSTKSELALSMTNCLFKQMGKTVLPACRRQPCKIQGDAWNTFSIFFNHIDNLCHFYREIVWQEKAEELVVSLTGSAEETMDLLQKNSQETNQILDMQAVIKSQMMETVSGQREMIELLGNSSVQIGNLTQDIERFLKEIHRDIDEQYSSLQTVLSAISSTLDNLTSVQSYLLAEVNTITGMLFYLLLFIGTSLLCSLRRFHNKRFFASAIVIGSFLVEWFFGIYIGAFIGNRIFRCLTIIQIAIILLNGESKEQKLEILIRQQLNTDKMARILRRAAEFKEKPIDIA